MSFLRRRLSLFSGKSNGRRLLIAAKQGLIELLEGRVLLSSVAVPGQTVADLPAAAQAAISSAIGQDLPAYQAAGGTAGVTLTNPANNFTAQVQAGTLQISAGSNSWDVSLAGLDYGAAVQQVGAAQTSASGNRVDSNFGTVDEWYLNGPGGLEQGFNVAPLPQADATGSLTLILVLGGDLKATANAAGDGLTLSRPDGSVALGYGGLMAHDAAGKSLPASLEVVNDGGHQDLLIHVNAAGAKGLITIDPLVQEAKLSASDGTGNAQFGYSISISGNTLVVGASGATVGGNAGQGAAYVFTEPESGWANMTQTAELTASDGAAMDSFGFSVSISGDTIVVGANAATVGGNADQGAAYVFSEPDSGWANMTQTAKLTSSGGAANDFFGSSVSISGDAVVAGAADATVGSNTDQGAAYVFTEPVSGWANTTQAAKLTSSDGAAFDSFGSSVSISGDTIAVGANGASVGGNAGQGAAYVFTEPDSGWATMTETAKLTASDGAAMDAFGTSIAVSGATVVAGAPGDMVGGNANQGAAYVFTEPVSGWVSTTETAKLTASDGGTSDSFGYTVSISGSALVVAAPGHTVGSNADQGAAYEFTEPGSGWATTTQNAELSANDGTASDLLGSSVSIAGNTVVAGAINATIGANSGQGAAYVFGGATATTLTVTAPSAQTAAAGQGRSFPLGSFTQTDTTGPYSVDVNWGDGSADTQFIQASTGTITPQSHTFASAAADTVTVTITDANGFVSNAAFFNVTVLPSSGAATIMFTSSANPAAFGAPLTLTAKVTGAGATPTGTVTFYNGSTALGSPVAVSAGIATLTLSTLPLGSNSLTAAYSGDSNYAPDTSSVLTQVVALEANVALDASANPAAPNTAVTFTATVTATGAAPTGTVTFFDGSTPLGSAVALSGETAMLQVSTLPDGGNSITAQYSGDSTYGASASLALNETISNLSPSLAGTVPASVIATTTPLKLREKLVLATVGTTSVAGTASANILLSTGETAAGSVFTLTAYHGKLKLKAGRSISSILKIPKSIPATVAAGTYHILIQFIDTAGGVSTIDSGQSLTVVAPVVDLTGSFVKVSASVKSGQRFAATFEVTNSTGANIAASGALPIDVETSPDGQLSDAVQLLTETRRINLKPGASIRITVTGKISSSAFVVVTLDQGSKVFPDNANASNNVLHTMSQISVVPKA